MRRPDVLGQANVTVEVIVVDDCPEGSARQLVEGFHDPRVIYLKNREATGGIPSIVRNAGWPLASGRYVHFLDDDDIVPEGHYARVAEEFARHPEVGLIFGTVAPFGIGPEEQLRHERNFFAKAARVASVCQRLGSRLPFTGRMLFDPPILVCSAGIIRRECLAKVGGFDPAIRLMEDAEFYIRVMRECGARFIGQTAVNFRIGSASLMHSPTPDRSQCLMAHAGHRQAQAKYRKEHGLIEFLSLALFTKTVLRVLAHCDWLLLY